MSHISNLSADPLNNRVRQREDEESNPTEKRSRGIYEAHDLFCAIEEREANRVEEILSVQPDLVHSNNGTCTPLSWFVIKRTLKRVATGYKENPSYRIAQALLNANADVNGKNPYLEMSPLLWAASLGKAATASYLLGHGADVNGKNSDGDTALMLSGKSYMDIETDEDPIQSETDKKEIPQLLIDANADMDLSNNEGFTALHQVAKGSGHPADKQWFDNLLVSLLVNQLEESEENGGEIAPIVKL